MATLGLEPRAGAPGDLREQAAPDPARSLCGPGGRGSAPLPPDSRAEADAEASAWGHPEAAAGGREFGKPQADSARLPDRRNRTASGKPTVVPRSGVPSGYRLGRRASQQPVRGAVRPKVGEAVAQWGYTQLGRGAPTTDGPAGLERPEPAEQAPGPSDGSALV